MLPQNIDVFIQVLKQQGAEKICVLTDLEDEASVNIVRDRIANIDVDQIFVAVKALEAWFLADTSAMRLWLGDSSFIEHLPEETADKPWNRLKDLARSLATQGPGSKVAFANKMIKHFNFDIRNSSAHANCPSASELVNFFNSP